MGILLEGLSDCEELVRLFSGDVRGFKGLISVILHSPTYIEDNLDNILSIRALADKVFTEQT